MEMDKKVFALMAFRVFLGGKVRGFEGEALIFFNKKLDVYYIESE